MHTKKHDTYVLVSHFCFISLINFITHLDWSLQNRSFFYIYISNNSTNVTVVNFCWCFTQPGHQVTLQSAFSGNEYNSCDEIRDSVSVYDLIHQMFKNFLIHNNVFWIDRAPSIHSGRHTDLSLENCCRNSLWCVPTDGYVCVCVNFPGLWRIPFFIKMVQVFSEANFRVMRSFTPCRVGSDWCFLLSAVMTFLTDGSKRSSSVDL